MRLAWAATVAAPFVAHAAIVTGRWRLVAACLAACQIPVVGTTVLRRGSGAVRMLGLAAIGVLAVLTAVRLVQPDRLVLPALLASSGLSHIMIHSSLLAVFAHSLQPGRTPLVTVLARRIRGPLAPAIVHYTRRVTQAWCLFFGGQIAVSAALFLLAPVSVWSLFVNVLDGPSVLLMFVGEYGVRRVYLRDQPHISPIAFVRRLAARGPSLPEQS